MWAHLCAVFGKVLHHWRNSAGGGCAGGSPAGRYNLPGIFSQGQSERYIKETHQFTILMGWIKVNF